MTATMVVGDYIANVILNHENRTGFACFSPHNRVKVRIVDVAPLNLNTHHRFIAPLKVLSVNVFEII